MSSNFLKSFLETGLFDIGDSDDRLTWLEQSIDDLQNKFEKDHSLLPRYSLVSLDPNISDKEPVLIETEEIVTNYWKALRGKYPEMPRNILRGVILNALNNVGTDNPIAARIIYLTMLTFFPYAKLNTEKALIEKMINDLGEAAENNAIEEWSFTENEPSLKLSTLKINNLKFGKSKISAEKLQPKLQVAIENESGGHTAQNHGGNSPWGVHFATEASESIASAFNEAIDSLGKSLSPSSIEEPINKFFTNFKKSLDSNLKTSFSSLTAVERRSKLLWWKETLYSQSLKRSYRGLDNNLLPIIMSFDLNSQLPVITPVSVDFLLKDTLFLLSENKDETVKFKDLLKHISDKDLKETLKPYFTVIQEDDGRVTISDFIALLVNERLSINDFKTRTGIDEEEEITRGELSVTVLHDLLTQRLIKE